MSTWTLFLVLQALDLTTTLIGFRFGAVEGSPFVRWLASFNPVVGVILSKLTAVAVAWLCVILKRQRLMVWANVWYIALVAWNASIIVMQLA